MLVVINGMLWIVSVEATVRESLTDFSRQRRQIVFTCAKICQLWQVPRHTHTYTDILSNNFPRQMRRHKPQ